MTATVVFIINLLTICFLLFGLFFMFVGALGIYRMPDLYGRMHAGSKCITLGITGLLIAGCLHLSLREGVDLVGVVTKAALVVVFQFVAAPVGSHMLSRAAHLDGTPISGKTLGDELADDRIAAQEPPGA